MQSAQMKARTELSRKYHEEYTKYYLEFKYELLIELPEDIEVNWPQLRSRAQTRAKAKLTRKHPADYIRLYEQAVSEGYPRGHKNRKAGPAQLQEGS